MANQNHFLDCICCAIVAIAARHGESNRLNIRKKKAAMVVGNHAATPPATFTASSVSPATLASTPMAVRAVFYQSEAAVCESESPRNHMTTHARNRIVPALMMNFCTLSFRLITSAN